MQIESLRFKGSGCFVGDWAGFLDVRPVNVIIGRNNTGKSQLLELVRISCSGIRHPSQWDFLCEGTLDEQVLRGPFPNNVSEGDLRGSHWANHGQYFVGAQVQWELSKGGDVRNLRIAEGYRRPGGNDPIEITPPRQKRLEQAVKTADTPLRGRQFRHLLADRDIRAEAPSIDVSLAPDGTGATNIIRRLITSSSADMPRALIQTDLRNALNEIFGPDGTFTEIQVQQHDTVEDANAPWEVFLGEERKGLVALSNSGSGLKTVILVLLHLIVLPTIEKKSPGQYVFAFEELENNLHPALLRRLFQYIEQFASQSGAVVFLTTHSSVALDLFGTSPNAQIVHVSHDGTSAKSVRVDAHFSRLGVISELGAKPSDLLQANGIIWVEGPSDAIYLNKWIDLASAGALKEGRDYLCAFYGGSLLARTQFTAPEEALDELVNLLLLNQNLIVVCDSDKTSSTSKLKPRVSRIKEEVQSVPEAIAWITDCKEIENYLPGSVLTKALSLAKPARSPDRFECFFPREKRTDSYCETVLDRKTLDKVELATLCVTHTDTGEMDSRFDWLKRMDAVVAAIRRWNA